MRQNKRIITKKNQIMKKKAEIVKISNNNSINRILVNSRNRIFVNSRNRILVLFLIKFSMQ